MRNLLDLRTASANMPAVNHRFLNNRSIKPRVELRRPNAETITTRHESISSNNNSTRRADVRTNRTRLRIRRETRTTCVRSYERGAYYAVTATLTDILLRG